MTNRQGKIVTPAGSRSGTQLGGLLCQPAAQHTQTWPLAAQQSKHAAALHMEKMQLLYDQAPADMSDADTNRHGMWVEDTQGCKQSSSSSTGRATGKLNTRARYGKGSSGQP